jgi:hypothetical protein
MQMTCTGTIKDSICPKSTVQGQRQVEAPILEISYEFLPSEGVIDLTKQPNTYYDNQEELRPYFDDSATIMRLAMTDHIPYQAHQKAGMTEGSNEQFRFESALY